MKENIDAIIKDAQDRLDVAGTLKDLEDIRVAVFGKKGTMTQVLKGMGALSPEERPIAGQLVNDARQLIERRIGEAASLFAARELESRLNDEVIDITLPGKRLGRGAKHPMTIVVKELCDLFIGMGFEIAEGPEIETEYYNFEALNTPKTHPARDVQDTFYMLGSIGEYVLRTQTSPVQVRVMEQKKPPIRVICPGKVYRSDNVDATHSPVFHQMEGLVVDKGVTMGDLKGVLTAFAKGLFGSDARVRFRPHYFPFTEPSGEMDVSCFACGGKGCRICKGDGWIELLGCGMVHPKVLTMSGIDPSIYSGYAFGMGLERVALQKYGIPDLRLLFENDVRFLKQFA